LHPLPRLADVELGVRGGTRMDVVQGLVAVADLEGLVDLQGHHGGLVHAAVLVEDDLRGGGRVVAGEPALHVHEGVGQAAVLDPDGLTLQAFLVHLLALGVGGDLDLLGGRRGAREGDLAGDGPAAGGGGATRGGGTGGRGGGRRRRGRRGAGAAATGDQRQGRGDGN